jgi:serralysin
MFYGQPLPHHDFSIGFAAFTAAEQESLLRTMQLVSDVANVSFTKLATSPQVPSSTNPFVGFYSINTSTAKFWGAATRYVTEGSGPPAPMGRIFGVDIVVNHDRADVQGGWAIGDSNSRKLMHELLHGLGLDHAGEYNGDSAVSYDKDAIFYQDSNQYTVMSYWAAAATGAKHVANGYTQFASTPLLYDVAALQKLYGANMSTRSGDTVYGFNSTSGRDAFNLKLDPSAVFTIWDGGGTDTLDLSGYASASRIDLREGAFSDAGDLTSNISIAFGAAIENATGGSGNDNIWGNSLANVLIGGAGNDSLYGGGGNNVLEGGDGTDTAQFDTARLANTMVAFGKTVAVVNADAKQTDCAVDVESLQFEDGSISVAALKQFDALDYTASYDDLIRAFGENTEAAFRHFAYGGFFEGRQQDSFDGLQYVAAYDDLLKAFGTDEHAAARHFVSTGHFELRQRDGFSGIEYVAAYDDLIRAFGADEHASATHFVSTGFGEGRQRDGFDALQYIAGYGDLILAFGANEQAGARHFVTTGFHEGRDRHVFDAKQYLENYADLRAAFDSDYGAATHHFITTGYYEGRSDIFV